MRPITFSIVAVLLVVFLNATAAHASTQDDVNQAVTIIQRFQEIPDRAIPDRVLRDAKGLAILTVTKAGFIGSAFSKGGNVTLGGNLSAAAGPVGRTAEGDVALQAAMYTYSISQGLFAGISLEGTVIATRDEANAEYYGKPVAAKDILAGRVKAPAGEQKLLQVLSKCSAPKYSAR